MAESGRAAAQAVNRRLRLVGGRHFAISYGALEDWNQSLAQARCCRCRSQSRRTSGASCVGLGSAAKPRPAAPLDAPAAGAHPRNLEDLLVGRTGLEPVTSAV